MRYGMVVPGLFLALTAAFARPFPADADCRPVWVSGTVDEVDWAGERFSLRLCGYTPGVYSRDGVCGGQAPGSIRFLVSRETSFVQQSSTLGFSSLAQSDDVSVLFCRGDFIDPVAIRVVINNAYPK